MIGKYMTPGKTFEGIATGNPDPKNSWSKNGFLSDEAAVVFWRTSV
jgi:hypothetical protein